MSFQNPPSPPSNTWITVQGTDNQSDTSLHIANETKWATLAIGAPTADRYINTVIKADPSLEDIVVNGSNPRGPGTVDVYVSTLLMTASVAQIAAISGSVQAIDFNGTALTLVTTPQKPLPSATAASTTRWSSTTPPGRTLGHSQRRCPKRWRAGSAAFQRAVRPSAATPTAPTSPTSTTPVSLLYAIPGVREVYLGNQQNISLGDGPTYQKLVVPTLGFVAPPPAADAVGALMATNGPTPTTWDDFYASSTCPAAWPTRASSPNWSASA